MSDTSQQDAEEVTVTCGDRKWSVKKDVVCAQSPFFLKAYEEGKFKEGQDGAIELKEDDASIVEAMLMFMYTSGYSDDVNQLHGYPPPVFNVYVHIMADKYEIPALAKLAEEKFEKRAKEEWSTAAFAEAAGVAYEAADRDHKLRDSVIMVTSEHAKELYSEDFGAKFREVASAVPALGSELLQKLATSVEPYRYKHCSKTFAMAGESGTHDTIWCPYCAQGYSVSYWAKWRA